MRSPRTNKRLQRAVQARLLSVVLAAVTLALSFSQGGCRAEQPWPLWQNYKAHFLDSSGRIIDRSANDRTTSEGQAYGMFFALVMNDRATFYKMLHWTEDNLAGGDLTARLPSWIWGRGDSGEWKPLDPNSAADADLWLAYDCLEAGRLWKDDRLQKLGAVLSNRIAHTEIALLPKVGTVVLPGPTGFHPTAASYLLNPSYTPPQVVARLRQDMPDGPWGRVQQALSSVLAQSSSAGFAMDWVLAGDKVIPTPSPQLLAQGKADASALGSYDAVRVYLWLGMADNSTPGVRESLRALGGMSKYLSANAIPPLEVNGVGITLRSEGTVGFSAAVIPYLNALAKKEEAKAQMNRLDASLDSSTGLYGRGAEYYDQNLILFSGGFTQGRFRFDREGRLKLQWKE